MLTIGSGLLTWRAYQRLAPKRHHLLVWHDSASYGLPRRLGLQEQGEVYRLARLPAGRLRRYLYTSSTEGTSLCTRGIAADAETDAHLDRCTTIDEAHCRLEDLPIHYYK